MRPTWTTSRLLPAQWLHRRTPSYHRTKRSYFQYCSNIYMKKKRPTNRDVGSLMRSPKTPAPMSSSFHLRALVGSMRLCGDGDRCIRATTSRAASFSSHDAQEWRFRRKTHKKVTGI